jgi:DNA-binding CsgD family transcriptional regulator
VTAVPDLLERHSELASVEQLIGDVKKGTGRMAVIEGSAGLGKTAVLVAACDRAVAADMRVLAARGGELEGELAFGVVRALFEGLLARAPQEERAELLSGAARLAASALELESSATADPSAALHGLYWLCANVAERGAVALIVDDAHWADVDSLRWLGYLARRVEALPVLALLAVRTREPGQERPILDVLANEPNVEVLALQPLTEAATAQLIKRRLGRGADSAFSLACHEATGGNPFYLDELLALIRDEGLEPTTENADRVPRLAPATVARTILLRLGRLGKDAMALARAVVVLGPDAELRHLATLAELDVERAQLAADRLAAADLLRWPEPLTFTHPIVAASVAGELEAGKRSIAHKRAARLVDAHGAPPDRVAVHLLSTAAEGDAWVVGRLLAAASWSIDRSAPEAAATFLRRALAERPTGERRADVLFELGRVERLVGAEEAVAHLAEAVERTDDVHRRAERAVELASTLQLEGRPGDAVDVCGRALSGLAETDRELMFRLEAARNRAAVQDPATVGLREQFRERFRGRLTGTTLAEREVLVELALSAAGLGTSADEVAETMALAVSEGRLFAEQRGDSIVVFVAINALTYADLFDEADQLLAQAMADVRQRGSLAGYVHVSTFRAQARLRRGLVREAEADCRDAVDAARFDIPAYVLPGTFALLVEALLERGDFASAEAELGRFGPLEEPPSLFPFTMLLHARALVALAQGRARDALADALRCGDRQEALCIHNPSVLPWRSTAALAYSVLGEADAAARFASEEVRLARAFGAPRASGIALRVAGIVEPRDGLPLLEEAVDVLSESPATLEHARALVDLGTALRHAGERVRARERLREALDLASQCGATRLADRARAELVIAGARPRRDALRGRDALTASELRIARMAADGMSNREIAQALFVSTKTVESHLRHVFEKLDVDSRTQLGARLDAGDAPPTAVEPGRRRKDQGVPPDAKPLSRA